MRYKKWETGETRCAQTHPFLIHFLYRTIGEAPSGLQVKNNGNQILLYGEELAAQNLVDLIWVLSHSQSATTKKQLIPKS